MPMPETPAEERFEQLLQASDFPPSAAFAAQAKVTDPAVYEQAAADPPAWWASQARQRLDWDTPFSEVLDDTSTPKTGITRQRPGAGQRSASLAGLEAAEATARTRWVRAPGSVPSWRRTPPR